MNVLCPRWYSTAVSASLSLIFAFLLVSVSGCAGDATPASGDAPPPTSAAVTSPETDPNADAVSLAATVERGRYLVATMGCGDCHTPLKMGEGGPEPDMARALSGHPEGLEMEPAPSLNPTWAWAGSSTNTAFVGPWGVSFASNLTPDENTGLGIWTEEMFVTALRTGKHMGQSRPIMPPMPWPAISQATDEDLKAIYAFLHSLQPVHNRVPDYQPPAAAASAAE